jgi:hypothetical protein
LFVHLLQCFDKLPFSLSLFLHSCLMFLNSKYLL